MNKYATVDGNHPFVQRTGRFHVDKTGGLSCAWSGSQVTICFEGCSIEVTIHDHAGDSEGNFLAVIVDDAPPRTFSLTSGSSTYRLAETLPRGEHTIRLFKQTEASVGRITLQGFSLENGTLLPPLPKPERRIEFIGDSITCGYGNEENNPEETFNPSTENHYLSYAQRAARELDAEAHVIAWSGEGILRNALGETVHPLPTIFGQVLPPAPSPAWDFSSWIPHVAVINLGTNDFLTGIPDREAFIGTYLQLLKTIDHHYHSPHIFCCLGPVITDTELATARSYLDELEDRAKKYGIRSLYRIEFETLRSDEFGADWHPNLAAHQRMADTLINAVRQETDW